MDGSMDLSAYGVWHVTTEGDCEGRKAADLGVHVGYLDEIAFELAPAAMYTLTFRPGTVDQTERVPSLAEKVSVSLDIKTWGMQPQERTDLFKKLLSSRPVQVEPSSFYAAATLKRVITPEKRAQVEAAILRNKKASALAKLSQEERKLLGL